MAIAKWCRYWRVWWKEEEIVEITFVLKKRIYKSSYISYISPHFIVPRSNSITTQPHLHVAMWPNNWCLKPQDSKMGRFLRLSLGAWIIQNNRDHWNNFSVRVNNNKWMHFSNKSLFKSSFRVVKEAFSMFKKQTRKFFVCSLSQACQFKVREHPHAPAYARRSFVLNLQKKSRKLHPFKKLFTITYTAIH